MINKILTRLLGKRSTGAAILGDQALYKVLRAYQFDTVLDIGAGAGVHTRIFRDHGKDVCAVDLGRSIYFEQSSPAELVIEGDYLGMDMGRQYDLVWASHVLEHQLNPHSFLKKIKTDLREEGILAITVPPLKHEIVGGHVSLWNAGLLLYHLVLAGFDCRDPSIKQYGYNISVLLRKRSIELPTLDHDCGDIERLSQYLPDFAREGFSGDIRLYNW